MLISLLLFLAAPRAKECHRSVVRGKSTDTMVPDKGLTVLSGLNWLLDVSVR